MADGDNSNSYAADEVKYDPKFEVKYEPNKSYDSSTYSYFPGKSGGNGASSDVHSSQHPSYNESCSILPDNPPIELDAATIQLIEDLKDEITLLDSKTHKHSIRLINAEIERLSNYCEPEYLEVDIPKPIKIMRKVLVPVHRNPKFNFVGKLLGPGGKTLQNLIQSTRCRIYILGKGSSREKAREEELLSSGDVKFSHLKDPLYVRVESSGPPAVAYQKIAHALNELQYYLQPVKDDIYLQQMADMGKPVPPPGMMGGPPGARGGMRGSLMGAAPPMRGTNQMRGAPRGGGRGRGFLMQTPPSVAPGSAPSSGPPPNYVTYPGYDYGGYGDYQQSAPSHHPPPHYAAGQAGPPPSGPPPPTSGPIVGGPPPGGPTLAPPPAQYGANNSYNYPYGYDYSQYNQHAAPALGQGPPPSRPPGPMPMLGGGKAPPPPMGRGRGAPRPAPY